MDKVVCAGDSVFGFKKSHPSIVQRLASEAQEHARHSSPQQRGNSENAVTIVTSGCHFVGKLRCSDSTRIGGKVEGTTIAEGLLIIEDGASIVGEVTRKARSFRAM